MGSLRLVGKIDWVQVYLWQMNRETWSPEDRLSFTACKLKLHLRAAAQCRSDHFQDRKSVKSCHFVHFAGPDIHLDQFIYKVWRHLRLASEKQFTLLSIGDAGGVDHSVYKLSEYLHVGSGKAMPLLLKHW